MMEKASDVVGLVTLENSGHALNNALVLCHIFKELAHSGSLEDLKNARLVTNSSNWQDELRKVWRRQAVLILEEHQNQSGESGNKLANFLDELGELDDFDSAYQLVEVPYERMKLRNLKVGGEADSPLENFCNAGGSSVKHLTLENVTLDMTPKQDLLLFLKAKFPNLESLCVDYVEQPSLLQLFEKERRNPGHRVTLDKVTKLELGSGRKVKLKFRNFPNLQEVKLFGERSLQHMTNGHMTIIPGVKNVDLLGYAIGYRVSVFSRRLHFSELEYLTAKTSDQRVINFLKAHSGTLRTLELFRSLVPYFRSNPIETDFSVLTTLRLWGNVMEDLSFLRFTPNLQMLHWDMDGYEKESEMWDEIDYSGVYGDDLKILTKDELFSDRCHALMFGVKLSKLEYCHLSCRVTGQNVRTLARWMPHLKTFNAVLDPRAFLAVCTQWQNLESLTCLYGSYLGDDEIVAPEDNASERPTVFEVLNGVEVEKTFNAKYGIFTVNGLTELKYLKSFSFYPECHASTLSDACVNQGFLRMPQLAKLHIVVSDKFSEASEQLLGERIPDLKIYRHNSSEKLDCCDRMEYKQFLSGEDSEDEEEEAEEEEGEEVFDWV